MRIFRALMSVLLLACLSPFLSMAVAESIAQIYGCKLDLTGVHPCMVGGRDVGHALLTLGMMGYFLFVTLPAAAAVVGVWITIELIAWARRRAA
jgi:hypothetical protein